MEVREAFSHSTMFREVNKKEMNDIHAPPRRGISNVGLKQHGRYLLLSDERASL